MKKSFFYLGCISYLLLLILAYFFYLERTAFIDIAFHLFYILKDGDSAIQNNRFGAFITQIVPLVGSKLQLELGSIMKLYSMSFVALNFAIFIVIVKVFKLWKYAAVLLLVNTLMVTDTFYWIQSEFSQGLTFLVFFAALLSFVSNNKKKDKWWVLPSMFTLLFTLVFFHPLMVFPFSFVMAYLYINNGIDRGLNIQVFLSFLFMYLIKYQFFNTAYDEQSSSGVNNFIDLFPDYFTLTSNKNLLIYALKDYYALFLGFFLVIGYLFKEKETLKLLLVSCSFVGYILLINVSFPEGAEQYYIENLYLPLSLIVAFPFVFDILSKLKKRQFLIAIGALVLIRIVHIGLSHQPYSERVAFLQDYLQETHLNDRKKLVINTSDEMNDVLMMDWATPYEFWLLSTITTGETRSIMFTDNPSEVIWAQNQQRKFITKWGVFDYDELPQRYFIFKDTSKYLFK